MHGPHGVVGGDAGWLGGLHSSAPGTEERELSAAFIVRRYHRAALVSLGGHGWGGGSAHGQGPVRQQLEKSGRTMPRPWTEASSNEGRRQRWKLAGPPNGDWKTFLKSDGHYLT